MKKLLATIIFVLGLLNTGFSQAVHADIVGKELQAYYEKGTPPDWATALIKLASDKADERIAAASYLTDLLEQALRDELSGKAPWRQTPYWGSRGENPARELRKAIAEELAKANASIESLQVIRWYFDHEKVPQHQAIAVAALEKVACKEADDYRLSLLQPVHENSLVALGALRQLGQRKTVIPEATMMALCRSYRPSLRDAARALNKERGGPDPGPFDAAQAMQSSPVADIMEIIGLLLDQPVPPDAPFVSVTTTQTIDGKPNTTTTIGWLVSEHGDTWEIATPFGYHETFTKEIEGNYPSKSSWQKSSIEEEVKRVIALREKKDPDFQLSERGGLTGQFQGRGASMYEVILAHWLYTAKQYELSAQILLPALDSLYSDRHLIEMVRQRVGVTVGHRMLAAFAGPRDIAETLRLARDLVQRYPDTRFHKLAVELSKEMPRRSEDFKKFKLPTPEEWAEMKKKLTRSEQIGFLCDRLRLLNCFQMGQPGGYSLYEDQYAGAGGISRDAAWGSADTKSQRVINPLIELAGQDEGYREEKKRLSKGLDLKIADIEHLAPYLRRDWHMLCVGFWRDFSPDRNLGTTRPLLAGIIDNLARKELCKEDEMSRMTDDEIDKHIAGIIEWARKNADKSEEELTWNALEDDVKAKIHWGRITHLESLIKAKDPRLVPVFMAYLDMITDEDELSRILSDCLNYNPSLFKEQAAKFAKSESMHLREAACRIMLANGDLDAACKVLGDMFELATAKELRKVSTVSLVSQLLEEGSDTSRKTVRRIFKNKEFTAIREGHPFWTHARTQLVELAEKAGIGDGYLAYSTLLDVKGKSFLDESYGVDIAEIFVGEVVRLAPKDPEIIAIQAKFPKPTEQIAPLKLWLEAKAKAIEQARKDK